eukprot:scaffold1401_cov330-Pavlova_lutheri.AAC.87
MDAAIRSGVALACALERPSAIAMARQEIPLARLRTRAARMAKRGGALDEEEALLRQLLAWFKREFFAWIDRPRCDACQAPTNVLGIATPTAEEARRGASRTEAYVCVRCSKQVRFPRYTDAETLLQTRKGRCGEWAQAFALCCRSLGYETRWVRDWSDHVWTECYLSNQGRWVHCDACENALDRPWMYEKGWKKDVQYVMGFAKDGVQDVTRRYTQQWDVVKQRRNLATEEWLREEIQKWNVKLRERLPMERKRMLQERDGQEHRELLEGKFGPANDATPSGRTSGSLQWRTSRGEVGDIQEVAVCDECLDDLLTGRVQGGVVVGSGQKEPDETYDQLFDGDPQTKWLDFGGAGNKGAWVRYRLPDKTATVTEYHITSANDCPERDPKDWELKGSADGGLTWTTLDERNDVHFSTRHQRKAFTVKNPFPCNAFQLDVRCVADKSKANCLQIACLDLIEQPDNAVREALSDLQHVPLRTSAPVLPTLQRIVGNLACAPQNEKYRRLRQTNPKVKAVLDCPECKNVLKAVGFVQGHGKDADYMVASSPNVEVLQQAERKISGILDNKESEIQPGASAIAKQTFEKLLSDEFGRLMAMNPEENPNTAAIAALKNVSGRLE